VGETRKIAAILVSDVVGYSRLTGADEDRILARLRALRSDLIDPTIAVHHGRVVKRTGDGAIVEFRSVVDAVRCAIEVQNGMIERNAGLPPERRIEFRIGIHLGDVVEESDGDLMGDGVNIAARLEGVCEPGGVCLSSAAHEQVRDRLKETFVDLGEKALKNIARPVRVYALAYDRQAAEPGIIEAPPVLLLPDKPSIAVLPFQNMSGDPEQDYFADGMVEDIVTGLSHIKWLFVIARNSSAVYKGKAVDVRQIGRELGVRYCWKGAYARPEPACASRRSSSKRKPGRMCGPTSSTARWRTSSTFRTRSPIAWSGSSSRASDDRRSSDPVESARKTSMPTISSCAPCPICRRACPRGRDSPSRCLRRR
jgi:adenylate cyclase